MSNSDIKFDITLAKECAKTFHNVTGIGCTISLENGETIEEYGFGCASCQMCEKLNIKKQSCINSHIYGMIESEKLGGKYIYYGPSGLNCFVSPIIGNENSRAKITVGPFMMVDKQDYIDVDLRSFLKISEDTLNNVVDYIDNIPFVPPEKVNDYATILFMAVGFLNNVHQASTMLETQKSDNMQSSISAYIHQLKNKEEIPPYPFDTENKLLNAVAKADRPLAQKYLNELLGYILFYTGNNLEIANSRVYEMLVLISRTSIKAGANPENCLILTHNFFQEIPKIKSMDTLCNWLSKVMNEFMDNSFDYMDSKHANVIFKSISYINSHYSEKITLEDMAQKVYLSPAYFSKIFKEETGKTFINFLNDVRIEKSKELLRTTDFKLIDICSLVSFDDQSYFTKVFKKHVGISPLKYRDNL
ncbi:MAG: AraC family transcriptional regulator [Oscillospiraceae bacterium]